MARPLGGLGRALYGMVLGLVFGTFLIFVVFMNFITGGRPGSAEGTAEQKSQERFMAMARNDWTFKLRDRDYEIGRHYVSQAVAGEPKATLDTTLSKLKTFDKSIPPNVAVYNLLHQKVPPLTKPSPEIITQAKEIAGAIQDPLLKADALRGIADALALYDADQAKALLKQANDVIDANPNAGVEQPGWFNNYMLLWPAGLAVFGFLTVFCLAQIFSASAAKPKTKLEQEEDDEEDEEEAKAEVPVVDVPVEPAPMAEMPADAELVGSAPAAEEVPMATDVPLPPPSPLAGKQSALAAAAQGAPAPTGNPDKKTMLARQGAAQATMLAKQGAATMLAKPGGGAAPTKVADSQEPMPLPDNKPVPNKTQKK